jgi:hypothetical protein
VAMEAELIIKSIMGLVVLLAVLMFFLFLEPSKDSEKKKKPSIEKYESNTPVVPDFKSLIYVIKNKKSNTAELLEAVKSIIKYYGVINKKLGMRPHPDFDIYADLLFTICRHKYTNKDIIIYFDRELGRLNPEYKKEINEAVTKGLNSRGA